jgi:hypothetical protein
MPGLEVAAVPGWWCPAGDVAAGPDARLRPRSRSRCTASSTTTGTSSPAARSRARASWAAWTGSTSGSSSSTARRAAEAAGGGGARGWGWRATRSTVHAASWRPGFRPGRARQAHTSLNALPPGPPPPRAQHRNTAPSGPPLTTWQDKHLQHRSGCHPPSGALIPICPSVAPAPQRPPPAAPAFCAAASDTAHPTRKPGRGAWLQPSSTSRRIHRTDRAIGRRGRRARGRPLGEILRQPTDGAAPWRAQPVAVIRC